MGIHSLSDSFKRRNMHNSKHRVVANRRKQKRMKIVQSRKEGYVDPVDLHLMHEFHSKKRKFGASANVALSGKKRRKLLKASRRMEREHLEKVLAEDAEEDARADAESEAAERRRKKKEEVRNIEMKDDEDEEPEEPGCSEIKADEKMET